MPVISGWTPQKCFIVPTLLVTCRPVCPAVSAISQLSSAAGCAGPVRAIRDFDPYSEANRGGGGWWRQTSGHHVIIAHSGNTRRHLHHSRRADIDVETRCPFIFASKDALSINVIDDGRSLIRRRTRLSYAAYAAWALQKTLDYKCIFNNIALRYKCSCAECGELQTMRIWGPHPKT